MQSNANYFLYTALFYPKSLVSVGNKDDFVNFQLIGKFSRIILWVLSLIFALFILGFTYKPSIWHLSSSDPLYTYLGVLNAVSLFTIGLIFFWLWVGFDAALLRMLIPESSAEIRTYTLLSSQTPWLALIPYFVIMRMLYAGSYYAWNYGWIAIIHVILAMGWHYINLGSILAEITIKTENRNKFPILFGFYLIFLAGLLVVLISFVPKIFDANAQVFLSQIF